MDFGSDAIPEGESPITYRLSSLDRWARPLMETREEGSEVWVSVIHFKNSLIPELC